MPRRRPPETAPAEVRHDAGAERGLVAINVVVGAAIIAGGRLLAVRLGRVAGRRLVRLPAGVGAGGQRRRSLLAGDEPDDPTDQQQPADDQTDDPGRA